MVVPPDLSSSYRETVASRNHPIRYRLTVPSRSIVKYHQYYYFGMALHHDAVDRISAYYRSNGLELRDASSSEAWLFAADPVEIEQ